jgi:gas vesicle protein
MLGGNDWYAPEEREQGVTGLGLVTLIVGAAIGAAAAWLYASKPGQDLRAQIKGGVGGWKDQAADLLAQGRERVVSAVEQTHRPEPATEERRPAGQVHVKE